MFYAHQVEAISPTLPSDSSIEERGRTSAKEDLLMQIQKVDNEIKSAETTMETLRKKEKSLMEEAALAKEQRAAKELNDNNNDQEPMVELSWRSQMLAEKIYAANRKTAQAQHSMLQNAAADESSPGSVAGRPWLPLYNQPLDVEALAMLIRQHQSQIRAPLLLHIRKLKAERWAHNQGLVEKYTKDQADWQRRCERMEASAKRKAREAKNREFFEKVFTELRKQREDKERFNRVGSRIKSEADLEEIMDGLQEQALEDKKMRSYAVIPPLMHDARQRRCAYHNENGLIEDMVAVHQQRKALNMWTAGEKETFKEKYLQHPKNFGAIAASLDRKSPQDCVRYYYLSKKTENYKQLLRKSRQRTRSSRNPAKAQAAQPQCIIDSMTTGVMTRLQREQQQKSGGRSSAVAERERAERAAERERVAEKAAADAAKAAESAAEKASAATKAVEATAAGEKVAKAAAAAAAAAATTATTATTTTSSSTSSSSSSASSASTASSSTASPATLAGIAADKTDAGKTASASDKNAATAGGATATGTPTAATTPATATAPPEISAGGEAKSKNAEEEAAATAGAATVATAGTPATGASAASAGEATTATGATATAAAKGVGKPETATEPAGTAAKGADSRPDANDPLAKTASKAINAEGYNGACNGGCNAFGIWIILRCRQSMGNPLQSIPFPFFFFFLMTFEWILTKIKFLLLYSSYRWQQQQQQQQCNGRLCSSAGRYLEWL